MRFRRKAKDQPAIVPVLVLPAAVRGEAVAFGHRSALETLGTIVDVVPAPINRATNVVLAAVPEFAATAGEVMGAQLKLTSQARRLFDTHEGVRCGQGLVGVVRDANGRFGGQLMFVEPVAGSLANAQALAATAALQMQMVAVEAHLGAIHTDLGGPLDSAHSAIDAPLASDLEILSEAFSEVNATGELTDTQWARVVNIEASVRRLHHRSSGHLRSLEEALTVEAVGRGEQVRRLKHAVHSNHSDVWLDVHVHAEKALTQLQALSLLRRVDDHPERAAEFAGALKAEVMLRFEALVQLGDTIVTYLATGHARSWTDRVRIISQARLRHLLAELDQILSSYSQGVEVIQLDAGSAAALGPGAFDVGSWTELAAVAGAADTRLLERLHRIGSRVMPRRDAGSKLARFTLTGAGAIIERLSPTHDDRQ